MTRNALLLAAIGLIASGCQNDFKLTKEGDGTVGINTGEDPDIEVSPSSVTFNDIQVGEGAFLTEVVTVTNVGAGDLNLTGLELSDADAPYILGNFGTVVVPSGESTDFTITFQPETAGDMSVTVYIDSNDPDEPVAEVPVTGLGIAPVIQVTPETYDFGDLYIGCELPGTVSIDNIGNATLVVESLNYATGSEDLTLDELIDENGPLPWTLAPDDPPILVQVSYYPLDEVQDVGYLTVYSNDPFAPSVLATQEGNGIIYGMQTDVYEQPLNGPVDILFAVDKSGSMTDDLANVQANFDTFIATLQALDSDYHVALVTADDGCINGSVTYIDNSMSSDAQQDAFDTMLQGSAGVFTEAPFQLMLNALATASEGSGGCNEGFLREQATLALVSVSDEREQSPNDWSYYVEVFRDLKSDDDDVVMHSIAGDYPSGCGGNEPGVGHYEATVETDGVFLSICGTDFGAYLQAIAEGSVSENSSFELTQEPVPETIEVTLDGAPTTEGWEYVGFDNGNYVDFDNNHIPEPGATIEITYVVKGDCEL